MISFPFCPSPYRLLIMLLQLNILRYDLHSIIHSLYLFLLLKFHDFPLDLLPLFAGLSPQVILSDKNCDGNFPSPCISRHILISPLNASLPVLITMFPTFFKDIPRGLLAFRVVDVKSEVHLGVTCFSLFLKLYVLKYLFFLWSHNQCLWLMFYCLSCLHLVYSFFIIMTFYYLFRYSFFYIFSFQNLC